MVLKEALFTKTGPAVAKAVIGRLFPEPVSRTAATSIFDLLFGKWQDVEAASKGEIHFKKLANDVADRLLPAFQGRNLSDNDRAAVANAVADRLNAVPLCASSLADLDNNAENLAVLLLENVQLATRDFSEPAAELYRRSLKLAAQYIINVSDLLPSHAAANFSEVLERLTSMRETITQVLNHVQRIDKSTPNQFEADYRQSLARSNDFMEIFGANLDRTAQKHQLIVAYISLNAIETGDVPDEASYLQSPARVEDTISPHKRALIIGRAGSGKTTLIKWLAVKTAQRDLPEALSQWRDLVPFLITLRLVKPEESFPAPDRWVKICTPVLLAGEPDSWVYNILRAQRGLILIDGIDEVPRARREAVREWIHQIREVYPGNRIILTSRPTAVQSSFDDEENKIWENWVEEEKFTVFELQDLQQDDLVHFVKHWHRAVEKVTPDKDKMEIDFHQYETNLLKALGATPSLRRLAVNPLLCAVICAVHYCRHMNLPKDRLDLYDVCIRMLLERDPLRKIKIHDYPNFGHRQQKNLMGHLAYSMMLRGLSAIDRDGMWKLIANRLEVLPDEMGRSDPKITCEYFLARTGLLREITPDEIDFAHRTFQEYLAAYTAVGAGELKLLLEKVEDDQWHETIVAAAGLAQDQSDWFVEKILKSKSPTGAIVALACMETASNVRKELREEVRKKVKALIPPMKKDVRMAIAAAGNISVPTLNYNNNWSANEGAACADTLGRIGTDEAIRALLLYLKDSRVTVTRTALSGLPDVKPGSYAKIICQLNILKGRELNNEVIEFIANELVWALEDKKRLISEVIRAPKVAFEVASYVPFFSEELIAFFKNWYLHPTYSGKNAFFKIGTSDDLVQVKALLENPELTPRSVAIEAFLKLAISEDLEQVKALLGEPEWWIRNAAVKAIGKLGTRKDLAQVKDLLKDPESTVRSAALETLGKLGTREDLLQVKALLKDPESMVRSAAVKTIGKLGIREDLAQVKALRKDPESSVRDAVSEILVEFRAREDLDQMKHWKNYPESWERKAAEKVRVKLKTKKDLVEVKTLLKDSDLRRPKTAFSLLFFLPAFGPGVHVSSLTPSD